MASDQHTALERPAHPDAMTPAPSTAPANCPECGKVLEGEPNYCPACGADLRGLSGAEFDRMYVEHMVKDHEKDIKEFEKESSKGEDSDVKSFAEQTLPKLREHLQTAQGLVQATGAKVSEPAGAQKKYQDKDQQK